MTGAGLAVVLVSPWRAWWVRSPRVSIIAAFRARAGWQACGPRCLTARAAISGRAVRSPGRRAAATVPHICGIYAAVVGYGVEIGEKKAQIVVPERRFTTSFLQNVQDEVVTFQINDRDSKAGGGSCFGDSGGPVFLGRFVAGGASFLNSLTGH